MEVHGGSTRDTVVSWLRRGSAGSKGTLFPSRTVGQGSGCPQKLFCLHPLWFSRPSCVKPWVAWPGPIAGPAMRELWNFLLTGIIQQPWCPDVCHSFQFLLCELGKLQYSCSWKSGKCGWESSPLFSQYVWWDGELPGMKHQGASVMCSAQMLCFQKNAIVFGCHLFRKGLSETIYRNGFMMTKSICGAKLLPEKKASFKIPLFWYE